MNTCFFTKKSKEKTYSQYQFQNTTLTSGNFRRRIRELSRLENN